MHFKHTTATVYSTSQRQQMYTCVRFYSTTPGNAGVLLHVRGRDILDDARLSCTQFFTDVGRYHAIPNIRRVHRHIYGNSNPLLRPPSFGRRNPRLQHILLPLLLLMVAESSNICPLRWSCARPTPCKKHSVVKFGGRRLFARR